VTLDTAYPLGFLLSRLVEKPALLTAAQRSDINESARNLLAVVKAGSAPNSSLFNTALSAICRTYEAAPIECRVSVQESIDPAYLPTHGYIVLPILAREAKWLLHADPFLLKSLYEATFGFEETSEQSINKGGPVFRLGFNRKQEVEHSRWDLGQLFKPFLEAYPSVATQTLMAVLECDNARTRPASYRQRTKFGFEFNGVTVHFCEDGSSTGEQFGAQDVAGEMLQTWVFHIDNVAANSPSELEQIVASVAEMNAPAAAWLKLLRAGTKYPEVVGARLRTLCWQPAILLSRDTAGAAHEFLACMYPRLTPAEKSIVDQAIVDMPRLKGYGSKRMLKHFRDQILFQLRKEDIATPEVVSLRDNLNDNDQGLDGRFSGAGPAAFAAWPNLDSASRDPVSQQLSSLLQPVVRFLSGHLNDVPDRESARKILPAVQALGDFLRRECELATEGAWIHERRRFAEVCAILARTKNVSLALQIRDLVMPLCDDSDPVWSQERDDRVAERGYSAASGVRGEVAVALGRIAPQLTEHAIILRALMRLASDPVAEVRREVAAHLAPITVGAPGWAWRLIGQRARKEANNGVLLALVQFPLSGLAKTHSERVSLLATSIYHRAQGLGAEALRKQCTSLFLCLSFTLSNSGAKKVLDRISGQPLQRSAEIDRAAFELRGWLVSDGTPRLDRIAELAWEFLTACVSAATVFQRSLDTEYTKYSVGRSSVPLESIQNNYEALHQVVNAIGDALFFASGTFEGLGMSQGKRETVLTVDQRVRFLSSAERVIESLALFGLPTVAHRLAGICEAYMDIDPRGNLLRLAVIVRAGRNHGYESDRLAVDLIVRLIERYLAECRHLFRGDADLQAALREILETFVGWPSALQLIYRLDDLSR